MNYLLLGALLSGTSPQKRSVVFHAYDYDKTASGFGKLSSHDGRVLSNALTKRGFNAQNIAIYENPNADGIRKAFKALIDQTGPGDIIYIHYSGHGLQIPDQQNGDESDGFDEALAPLGSKNKYEARHEQNYIRDDEIQQVLQQLRKKAGKDGHVLMSFDSCHAGSLTRSVEKDTENRGGIIEKNISQEGDTMASYVTIEAAKSDQKVYEIDHNGLKYGPLSLALSRQFEKEKKVENYHEFFQGVRDEMAFLGAQLEPQVEGILQASVLDKGYAYQTPFFRVQIIGGEHWILGGRFNGLEKGATVEIHSSGVNTPTEETKIADALVDKTENGDVRLKSLNERLPIGEESWAFLKSASFYDLSLRLKSKGLNKDEKENVLSRFATNKNVSWANWFQKGDIEIRKKKNGFEVIHHGKRNPKIVIKETIEDVSLHLLNMAKTTFIEELKLNQPNFNIKTTIQKCREENGIAIALGEAPKSKDGVYQLVDKETVMFVIENTGKEPGFPVILNSENGKISSIYPFFDGEKDELRENVTSPLPVGRSLKSPTKALGVPCFAMTHSEDLQLYKVFLTSQDVGLWKMRSQTLKPSMRSIGQDKSKIPPIAGKSLEIWVKTKKK